MEGVKVSSYGLYFVFECLRRYLGGSWYIAGLFLLGLLIWPVLSRKKSADGEESVSTISWMNLTIVLFLALTACNPFLVMKIVPKIGMTSVYYRIFWALPFVTGAAYYLTLLYGKLRSAVLSLLLIVGILTASAFVMGLNPGIPNLTVPSNVYKVDGAIPVLCEEIHRDFEKTESFLEAEEDLGRDDFRTLTGARQLVRTMPRCIFPFQLEFAVRQYDAGIALTFDRNLRLYYEGNRSTGISYENSEKYHRRALILNVMYGYDDTASEKAFRKAMEKTGTDYLVVEKDRCNELFLNAVCNRVSEIAGYVIFRYEL